jgi:hypothetical protein
VRAYLLETEQMCGVWYRSTSCRDAWEPSPNRVCIMAEGLATLGPDRLRRALEEGARCSEECASEVTASEAEGMLG